jgi:hypothetical protein
MARRFFRANHNYLTIWGYWNGSAEMTEDRDEAHVQPVDLGEAVARGLITTELRDELLERVRQRLEAVGYRDLQLRAGHVLLSVRHDKSILLDSDAAPVIRLCNFELMEKVSALSKRLHRFQHSGSRRTLKAIRQ